LYELAAAAGNSDATVALGFLHEIGHAVKQDYAKAEECYKKAVRKKNGDAMAALGDLELNGKSAKTTLRRKSGMTRAWS
jgi:TPR repeat protein